jgi:hypothetical protein
MYKSDYFQQKKKTLTLINYVQNEGTSKLNSKTKIKKMGEPKTKFDIVLDVYAAHDWRDRSLGSHLISQKKRKIQNRKRSRAADGDTKDK